MRFLIDNALSPPRGRPARGCRTRRRARPDVGLARGRRHRTLPTGRQREQNDHLGRHRLRRVAGPAARDASFCGAVPGTLASPSRAGGGRTPGEPARDPGGVGNRSGGLDLRGPLADPSTSYRWRVDRLQGYTQGSPLATPCSNATSGERRGASQCLGATGQVVAPGPADQRIQAGRHRRLTRVDDPTRPHRTRRTTSGIAPILALVDALRPR